MVTAAGLLTAGFATAGVATIFRLISQNATWVSTRQITRIPKKTFFHVRNTLTASRLSLVSNTLL